MSTCLSQFVGLIVLRQLRHRAIMQLWLDSMLNNQIHFKHMEQATLEIQGLVKHLI